MYQNFNPYQVPNMTRGIQYVNGIRSAEMYQMQPNQEVILMDSNSPVFYLKTTDASGMASIREYEFKERVHAAPDGMEEIKDRLTKLEFAIASMKEAQNESITSKQTEQHAGPIQSV